MKGVHIIRQNYDWLNSPIITQFETQRETKGTHIPTEKPRSYIGLKGEIMIDDDAPRDRPYVKIGDGVTSFDNLDYLKMVKDYYSN